MCWVLSITNLHNDLMRQYYSAHLYRRLKFMEVLHLVQGHTAGKFFGLAIAQKEIQFSRIGLEIRFFHMGLPVTDTISTHTAQKLQIQILVCIVGLQYPELSSHFLPACSGCPSWCDNPLPTSDKPSEWLTQTLTFSSTQRTERSQQIFFSDGPFQGVTEAVKSYFRLISISDLSPQRQFSACNSKKFLFTSLLFFKEILFGNT